MKLAVFLSLGLSVSALALSLISSARVSAPPVQAIDSQIKSDIDRLSVRMSEVDSLLDRTRSIVEEARGNALRERDEPLAEWEEWCRRIESQLHELRSALEPDIHADEEMRNSWLENSRAAEQARRRYQQTFLRSKLSWAVRAQALSVLGEFPDEDIALSSPVRTEIKRIVEDPRRSAAEVSPLLVALGGRFECDFAKGMLLHAARYSAAESVRAVALKGLETWNSDPEVHQLLRDKLANGSPTEQRAATIGLGEVVPRQGPKIKDKEE